MPEDDNNQLLKRHKADADFENSILINQILQMRQQAKEKLNPVPVHSARNIKSRVSFDENNISYRLPKYPFITLTRIDGEKVYVRCHSEEYEKEELKRIASQESHYRLLGDSSKELWKEANEIINKMVDNELNNGVPDVSEENNSSGFKISEENNNSQLWVDMYKPKSYFQLLSDESTNRSLLKWLKMWDKVVFNRNVIQKVKQNEMKMKSKFQKQDIEMKFDDLGRPERKVALLCGAPGLGKTTLAHIVARQAGYNVVEVNASDDRSTEAFKTILKNATQMRSFIDRENRPNCLIFDEIDGAPQSSIDYLVKFVTDSATTKSTKGTTKKRNVLKRPIICICNDVYVPALKPLRQIAFVVNFPQTSTSRLAERLCEIARHQGIKTDMGALLALGEKSNNDIRSCISILHFFKSLSKKISLSDVYKTNIGQKDMQKGLFAVWNDIFQIERNKQSAVYSSDCNARELHDSFSLKNRMKKILNDVSSFGDYERLAQGVFENFTNLTVKDSMLTQTCEALEWFSLFDKMKTRIRTLQDYSLMRYLPYAFVVWHFVFGSFARPKLSYPNADYEARVKLNKTLAIVREVLKQMQPSIRTYTHINPLILDILPLLVYIIVPLLRPVNLHLYTQKEKEDLERVVNTMIDYNLNYVQERHPDGNYSYELDPNINEVAYFSISKPSRTFSYSIKQLISQEIEVEKIRRLNLASKSGQNEHKENGGPKKTDAQNVPNHLQRLKPKLKSPKETIRKDFFGRVIKSPTTSNSESNKKQNDIWYHYKEGYSNAVRKSIKISTLK
ncbi:chromosome transmission fidelity protein 18 homolog [Agrilus planipennis]|uniref:Chromosome transmission fidelity protein 18 homolog n=1 Tax=Agrilus planipennis TaxID=224129 RepID=A0A1W4WCS3_AGRPL|nr:chromosome transmission fidelity protein 18 homolog [Agrilus planipennis]